MTQDLTPFAGKWVAIVDDEVVASSENGKEAFERGKENSGKTPRMQKVHEGLALL